MSIATIVGESPQFSQFKKLVERCGSMASLERNEGLAPLLLPDEAFDRLSAAEKQRLESDTAYCRQVTACHIAGFDCVAATHSGAKLDAGVNGSGNVVSYAVAGVAGRATDVEVSNGVLLVTPSLLTPASSPVAPGKVSEEIVKIHRESHINGTRDASPAPAAVKSVGDILRLGTELSDFRALVEEFQVPVPTPDQDVVMLVIPNALLRELPKDRLAKLRANKDQFRRILQCHMDAEKCFAPTKMSIEATDEGPGMRFGNLVAFGTDMPKIDHGLVLVVKDFATPPAKFRPGKPAKQKN